jgi:RimJ/RimL family protein N-acetyltransferase
VKQTIEENGEIADMPEYTEILHMTVNYYRMIGFSPPWIGYFVKLDGKMVGSAGYKGAPVNNTIEIAYGVFPGHQNKGIGTAICRQLVKLALQTDPQLVVTARTLPENNYSTKILQKSGFILSGTVFDKDDGDVWEWKYEADFF